jgi:hypothetical protein
MVFRNGMVFETVKSLKFAKDETMKKHYPACRKPSQAIVSRAINHYRLLTWKQLFIDQFILVLFRYVTFHLISPSVITLSVFASLFELGPISIFDINQFSFPVVEIRGREGFKGEVGG